MNKPTKLEMFNVIADHLAEKTLCQLIEIIFNNLSEDEIKKYYKSIIEERVNQ